MLDMALCICLNKPGVAGSTAAVLRIMTQSLGHRRGRIIWKLSQQSLGLAHLAE